MSSQLYRSVGGSVRFYSQSGAGLDKFKDALNKKVGPVPVWALAAGGILILVVIIAVVAKKKSGFEGFAHAPGFQTASGFGGTMTLHRSQHSPRNREMDNQFQLQEMGYTTGDIATGEKNEGFAEDTLMKSLTGEGYKDVSDVPADQSIVPIPAMGQGLPTPFQAGRADFTDGLGPDYSTNTNWLQQRLKKKEQFADLSASATRHNELNMGYAFILPEDDYALGGVSADSPGSRQQAGKLNPRTMGQSGRPLPFRVTETFADQPNAFDILSKKVGEGYADLDVSTADLSRGADQRGTLPLTALQASILRKEKMVSGSQTGAPTFYGYAHMPSSYQSRNMLSGQPNAKARDVVTNYCKNKASPACKKDPLCGWNGNSQSCMPARRPANECAFPVNPKYAPVDPKTGMKRIIPADSCISSKDANFNKWVETNWVLNYDAPYQAMQSSDLYYKQLQNVLYHNPSAWEVKKPSDTKTSMEPGAVNAYQQERRGPVGVDDSKLVSEKIAKKGAAPQKDKFMDVGGTLKNAKNKVRDFLGL